MDQSEIINLIKDGVKPGLWADLGSGTGAFTLALKQLAGSDIEIYSVDANQKSLNEQKATFEKLFPDNKIHFLVQDFTKDLNLPKLDGILMANSLHFVKYKESFLEELKNLLKPDGRLLIVEYDTDQANPYVPHPLAFGNLEKLLIDRGFEVKLLAHAPSRYQNRMYSAVATVIFSNNKKTNPDQIRD
jgi:ubiquinone/menaquinone biosynthesis C-methylase UbiE